MTRLSRERARRRSSHGEVGMVDANLPNDRRLTYCLFGCVLLNIELSCLVLLLTTLDA